jgi:hypothetical protein
MRVSRQALIITLEMLRADLERGDVEAARELS